MSVAIEDVPRWLVLEGIGHAVQKHVSGWYLTGCGTFTPNGPDQSKRPTRICSKCRARLKEATLMCGADYWRAKAAAEAQS